MIISPLNLTFDQALFIFNMILGIELRDQLLVKYKLEFDNLVSSESSGCYLSIDISISRFRYHLVSQFEDLHRSVHFEIFLIFDFQ